MILAAYLPTDSLMITYLSLSAALSLVLDLTTVGLESHDFVAETVALADSSPAFVILSAAFSIASLASLASAFFSALSAFFSIFSTTLAAFLATAFLADFLTIETEKFLLG